MEIFNIPIMACPKIYEHKFDGQQVWQMFFADYEMDVNFIFQDDRIVLSNEMTTLFGFDRKTTLYGYSLNFSMN